MANEPTNAPADKAAAPKPEAAKAKTRPAPKFSIGQVVAHTAPGVVIVAAVKSARWIINTKNPDKSPGDWLYELNIGDVVNRPIPEATLEEFKKQ